MKSIEEYMHDPDIADEPVPLREIHAIRLRIQDETRGMSPGERAKSAAEQSEKVIEQYGLKIRRGETAMVKTL